MSKRVYQFAFDNLLKSKCDELENLAILEECVEFGIDIREKIDSYLHWAIENKYRKIINFLLSITNPKDINRRILIYACVENDLETVKLLLDTGLVPILGPTYTPDVTKLLIDYGANPFADDNELFRDACVAQNFKLIKYLIDIGVDHKEIKHVPVFLLFGICDNLELKKIYLENCVSESYMIVNAFYSCNYDDCKLLLDHQVDISECEFKYHRKYKDKIDDIIKLFAEYGHDIRNLATAW